MKKILSKRLFISEVPIVLAVSALSLLPLLDIRYTAYYYYGASLVTLLLAITHGLLFRRSTSDSGKLVHELRITLILFLVSAIIAFALTRYFHLNPQFLTYLFPFLIPLVCRLAYREFVKAFPILTLLLLMLVADSVKAQKIVFNKVGANEDNPTARIFGITQDAEGYMWFASNGLLKFDGYEYIRYSNDPLNNNSIISNQVTCVFAAKDGMIWIGTDGKGLDKFDPVRGSFTHYKHQPKIATSLANDQVRAIAADKDGNIWVGTQEGLDMLDPKSGNFRHFLHSDQTSSISDNWINSILVDHDGIVWVGTGAAADEKKPAPGPDEGGLNRFEKSTATFTRFLKADQHGLLNNTIRAIYEDSKNNLWIGTGANLLFALDRKQATFQYFPPDQGAISQAAAPPEKKSVSNPEDYVTFIREDAAGALWIGSKSNGVNRFDRRSGKLSHYDENDGGDNSAIAGYSSADGLFWISSNTGALYKIDPILNTIPHYPASGPVFAIYKDAAGSLWIGTSNGLYRNDPGGSQRFSYDPFNLSSLSNNIVFSINEDSQNRLWIGTDGGGLNVFNKFTRSFSSYLNEKTNKQSIASNVVYATCDENDRSIWVGTQNGLDLLDKTSGRFTHYIHDSRDSGSIGNNFIEAIIRDHENTIWVGSGYKGGINKLDRASNKFKHFLNDRSIYSLFEDHAHSIWAGTDSGLYYRTASAAEFLPFLNPNLDLSRASVISIVEDLKGKLWINTSLGIVELDEKRAVLGLYGKRYGIGVSSFVLRAGFADNTGQIYFSGNDGYYAFDQNFLIPNIKSPNLIVTDFRLMDQSVRAGTGPLRGEINKTDELRLSYKQNVFSFDFAALDYTSPEDNQHFFMLENYDNGWHKSGTDRKAYYFNVPPGHYTFRVKGYNGNGFGTEKRIEIYIRPPWWQTWWAYTLFAVVLGSIIWGIVYYRGRKLRMKNKELEEMVSERTNELQQSLQDLKATQSQLVQVEKMASLGELTAGIAHEIQNPLNFVNNFSELNSEMITEMKTELLSGKTKEAIALAESIEENQNKITHHGKRADGIVKGMLQHSRKSTGMKEATDIVALADECIRLSYHGLRAKEKSFNASIQTAFDNNLGKVNVISQDLGRVFLNLMNNAFYSVMQKKKELKENYEPTVFVSINGLRAENKVVILIRDNGLGIPQKVVDKIFQPFFTTKPTGQGTGLGLSLSYDIVKAHGGQITVESKEGEGATFTITIPAY